MHTLPRFLRVYGFHCDAEFIAEFMLLIFTVRLFRKRDHLEILMLHPYWRAAMRTMILYMSRINEKYAKRTVTSHFRECSFIKYSRQEIQNGLHLKPIFIYELLDAFITGKWSSSIKVRIALIIILLFYSIFTLCASSNFCCRNKTEYRVFK